MWRSSASQGAESPRVRRIEDHRPIQGDALLHPPTLDRQRLLQMLGRCVVLTAVSSFVAVTLWLLARRLSAPLQPLSSLTLVLLGLLFAAVAAGLRSLWWMSSARLSARSASNRLDSESGSRVPLLISSGILLLLGVGLSIPGTNGLAWLLFGAILVVGEFLAWRGISAHVRGQEEATDFPLRTTEGWDDLPELPACPAGENLVQQSVRSIGNGQEIVRVEYRCEFLPGERQQVAHVLFQPPFSSRPVIEASLVEARHITLKVAQAETYGVRLELRRRGECSRSDTVRIQLKATASVDS